MSFVRDDTVFLDIGANLGFYSLKVAQRNKLHGKIHAFEPHPTLVRLAAPAPISTASANSPRTMASSSCTSARSAIRTGR